LKFQFGLGKAGVYPANRAIFVDRIQSFGEILTIMYVVEMLSVELLGHSKLKLMQKPEMTDFQP